MCSLGHHEDAYATPTARVRRRRAESASVIGPSRPPKHRLSRKELAKRRAAVRADLEACRDMPPAPEYGDMEQLELIPPHEQNLPEDHMPRSGRVGLPDPSTLYYSAAREA